MKKVCALAFLPFHCLWADETGRAVGWVQWWPSVAGAAATLLLLVVVSPQKAEEAFVPSTDRRRARETR